ncbi:MAG: NYN domain-containing protein [Bacteroidetes bacterium]|nr:NYN domain-containing protein [Bacteroidota bacterium]
MIKIAVFYDGNYFLHVSNYYNYVHARRSRLSITGLHQFIRHQASDELEVDVRHCHIVDAHYFRGRYSAWEASQRGNQLFYDRLMDDNLMSEGVVTHYLPIKNISGFRMEKGVDVCLALEAFELAFLKKFEIVVLVASDGDYVPLIKKLNANGTKVMVLSWDFEYTNDDGQKMVTRTSQDLLEEVTYPVAMHEIIENRLRKNEPVINNLFIPPPVQRTNHQPLSQPEMEGEFHNSTILSLKSGYGFIKYPPNNLFFHYTSLLDTDFNEIHEGDTVEFHLDINENGEEIARDVRLIRE